MIEITVQTLNAMLPDIEHLIDVREPDEYAEGHVDRTVNLPLSTIDQWLPTLSKDSTYTVICRSGRRSSLAIEQMKRRSITGVNVNGGTLAWQGAGYPVTKK
ncbi:MULTISPECIES: rhodanese-like domain-containing protein [Furfurilactobacillus]|uniref:Rhodanese-like domain-containing protein n=1 Tax=Furfurilactobacillus rossiae TaxID=231049 RepID=A0A7C9N7I4_9LACO|nr:rhodanese-like domain-containing protein [Furfurilactobacillus milii]MYV05692.1 rhodanese-like domain-containing protein [Furfurilactobacillus milii]